MQVFEADGTAFSGTLANDPFGFGAQFGYYTDAETGLILCTFRYYDPNTGRWINRDPIGYSGGVNLYAYVTGNPVGFVDPSGNAKIYLCFRQVWINTPFNKPFYSTGWHAYLRIEDEDTHKQCSVSGGPASDKKNYHGKGFGNIVMFASEWNDTSYDWPSMPEHVSTLIRDDNKSAKQWFKRLTQIGSHLEDAMAEESHKTRPHSPRKPTSLFLPSGIVPILSGTT
ncbi:MAG: RHS repeat-associated core domain-containing protein [Pedobacter sp.]|nr:MAG: RHS repeat-associated core domain-containing protein [Pedobacter sp.]